MTGLFFYPDADGEWRWQARAGNSEITATGAEGYKNRVDCVHGATVTAGLLVRWLAENEPAELVAILHGHVSFDMQDHTADGGEGPWVEVAGQRVGGRIPDEQPPVDRSFEAAVEREMRRGPVT